MITKEDVIKRPLSFSSLKAFERSPLHYMQYVKERRKETPAMALGSLIDCLLLTPDEFSNRFVIKPDFSVGEGIRAKKKIWEEENQGKSWITQEQFDEATNIVYAVTQNPVAKEMIGKVTETQKKLTWTDKETGLPMISYLDMKGEKFIVDLKSTTDAHPDEFTRSAAIYEYYLQAAIYLEGMKYKGEFPDFYFIVVESKAPYGVAVYKANKEFLELGKQQYHKLLQEFKFCMEEGMFDQSYQFRAVAGYYQLDLPGYLKAKINK